MLSKITGTVLLASGLLLCQTGWSRSPSHYPTAETARTSQDNFAVFLNPDLSPLNPAHEAVHVNYYGSETDVVIPPILPLSKFSTGSGHFIEFSWSITGNSIALDFSAGQDEKHCAYWTVHEPHGLTHTVSGPDCAEAWKNIPLDQREYIKQVAVQLYRVAADYHRFQNEQLASDAAHQIAAAQTQLNKLKKILREQ